ncbi:MAG: hypothetical protein B6241_11700 [Spirochaetaceae bacterium 4572_59]|nr:MAG: hypothetical protein B6241_11700 [Spirochaetaceae bacterium 4572_59]
MKYSRKEEGFRGQQLFVIPPDVTALGSLSPLNRNLRISAAGYYPAAAGHQKSRQEPIVEGILLYCRQGSGFVRSGGKTFFLHARQACYLPPGQSHIYGSSDNDPWSLYWMHLKGDLLDMYLRPLKNERIAAVSSEADEQVLQLFEMLFKALERGYSREIMVHTGQLAAAILTTLFYSNRDFNPRMGSENSRRLDDAVNGMQERVSEGLDFSLSEMALSVGLSIPHFSELFKKGMGYPPVEYFSRLRIQKACRLLELTDRSIQKVAVQCAYADQYYFSRVFKKIMGLPPSEYRKKVQQKV